MQIYQELDIGSAKPDDSARAKIKHHLIDVLPPNQIYSVGIYIDVAIPIITDIIARGNLPLIVGGTMFYVKTLIDGIDELPSSEPARRKMYLNKYKGLTPTERSHALHTKLAQLDAKTAERLNPADEQRILRALELNSFSGLTLDELFKASGEDKVANKDGDIKDSGRSSLKQICAIRGWQIITFALNYPSRETLREKLAIRFQQFMQQGLLEEVKQLRNKYPDLDFSYPALRAIGYRQLWEYLEQLDNLGLAEDDEQAKELLAHAQEKSITSTRQFAKRQITWLGSWPDLNWLDASQPTTDLAKQVFIKLDGWA